jgi:hypothetical protein
MEVLYADVKNVAGRKTDVNDAAWWAGLMAHGLIRGSFVPTPRCKSGCCAPASNWFASGPATSSGCTLR